MKNFLVRTGTSVVLLAGGSAAFLFLSGRGMIVFVSVITAGLIWEYTKLVFFSSGQKVFRFFLFGLCFLSYLCFVFDLMELKFAMLLTVYLSVMGAFWVWQRQGAAQILTGVGLLLVSLFYVAWPAGLFLKMFLYETNGPGYLLLLLCVVFAGDVFAYIGGALAGGRKWLPHISPGKTWAGLICGLCAAGLTALGVVIYDQARLFNFFEMKFFYILGAFCLGALCFWTAQTGDLFVSVLKRNSGVKDTGRLLPGHGGLLDRLDGLLMALPFMYMMLLLLESY